MRLVGAQAQILFQLGFRRGEMYRWFAGLVFLFAPVCSVGEEGVAVHEEGSGVREMAAYPAQDGEAVGVDVAPVPKIDRRLPPVVVRIVQVDDVETSRPPLTPPTSGTTSADRPDSDHPKAGRVAPTAAPLPGRPHQMLSQRGRPLASGSTPGVVSDLDADRPRSAALYALAKEPPLAA
jgi:hypothetical protein